MRKHSQILIGLLISLKLTFLFVTFFWPETAYLAAITPKGLFELNNEERQEENLNTLVYSDSLEKSAEQKAEHMLQNNYFDHKSPDEISPWYWFKKNDYRYLFAGENLAIDFFSNKDVHDAWMNSQTHKANILNPYFKDMGVGIVTGKYNEKVSTVVVSHFGTVLSTSQIAGVVGTPFGNNQYWWQVGDSGVEQVINFIYLLSAVFAMGYFIYLFYKDTIGKKDIKKLDYVKVGSLFLVVVVLVFV